jgi:excisionase family DNA binding protein
MIYSKKALAEKLGISTKTVERAILSGVLSFHRIGKRILFDETDFQNFWNACRTPLKIS